jgi:hypothetical protein
MNLFNFLLLLVLAAKRVTSILTKLKYKNCQVAARNSLHRIIDGSARVWVQEGVDEVISCPADAYIFIKNNKSSTFGLNLHKLGLPWVARKKVGKVHPQKHSKGRWCLPSKWTCPRHR